MIISHHAIAIATAVAIFGGGVKIISDRTPCFEVHKVELLTPEVEPGGKLRWRLDGYRHKECRFSYTDVLIDGAGVIVPYEPVHLPYNGPAGPVKGAVLESVVPSGATPGKAQTRRVGDYRYSPIHNWWPLPAVVLAELDYKIIEAPEQRRVREILRLLNEPPL